MKIVKFASDVTEAKRHSTFCTEEYTHSEEYRDFWMRLAKGEFLSGRFHRVGKYGRHVHIQAAYNPILDLNGKVMKVVKSPMTSRPRWSESGASPATRRR